MILDFLKAIHKKSSGPFSPGDAVEAFGNRGVVKRISHNGMFLEVTLEGAPSSVIFHTDGKLFSWSKTPSLRKV
jgi:hypothetical protein